MSRPPRFTDAASRYQRYMRNMELLAEEASRPPQSLATTYFVGSGRFVRRMAKRFGLDAPGRSVERRPLGAGVVACGPRLGDPGRRRGHASS